MKYYVIKTGQDGIVMWWRCTFKSYLDIRNDITIGLHDIDEYVRKIEENICKITSPKMPIFGFGWILNFRDPADNVLEFALYVYQKIISLRKFIINTLTL